MNSTITEHFSFISDLVKQHSCIVLEAGKEYLVEARLTRLAIRENYASIDQLILELKQKPFGSLHKKVVDAMTTNETYFFRDVKPFDLLKNHVIGNLIHERRNEKKLAIWSAACSTGQEIYSIAILLKEYFPELAGWNVFLLASDISSQVLEKAKAGVYSPLEIGRGLPVELLHKYFDKKDGNWHIKSVLRHMVEFRNINLAHSWVGLPKMDVVFLRNVLIYFGADDKQNILKRMKQQIFPDGYLFLGSAETTYHFDDLFVAQHRDKTTYYRPKRF